MQNYGPQLLQFLDQEVDPDQVCKYIGLCSSSVAVEVEPVDAGSANGLECTICQWVAGELEKLVTKNSTESEIIAAVEKVCFILPSGGLQNLVCACCLCSCLLLTRLSARITSLHTVLS